MATRSANQKPDPAIQRNIRRARAGKRGGRDPRGVIATASLAATLGAWALFAHQDAQSLTEATAVATPTPIVAAAQMQSTPLAVTASPVASTITLASQTTAATTTTTTASTSTQTGQTTTAATPTTTTASTSAQPVAAVARTQSSR